MKSTRDKYNFAQASPIGKFGFEGFKNELENKYYFHFNTKDGNVILYSQAYASARSRDNGLNSVRTNATDISRFAFHSENKKHYFSLIAGNNQEIARSQLFSKKEEMESAMTKVLDFANQKTRLKSSAPVKKAVKKPAVQTIEKQNPSQETVPAKDTVAQTKSRITIDFYRNKAGEPLKGRIEHPLSGAKVKFQGFDRNMIINFIEQHIPMGEKQNLPIKADVKAQIEENLSGIRTSRKGLITQLIHPGESFDIEIPLPSEAQQYSQCNLEVYAKQLGKSQVEPLGKGTVMLSNSDKVVYTVKSCPLQSSTHRLLVHLFLNNENEQQAIQTLKGSSLLLVQ